MRFFWGALRADSSQTSASPSQHETVKGQAVHLLRVAAEDQVDAAVRCVKEGRDAHAWACDGSRTYHSMHALPHGT